MRICYERLVEAKIVRQDELHFVDLWLKDIEQLSKNIEMATVESLT